MTTRSGTSSTRNRSTCSSTMTASSSGARYAASVARPSGGNSEYLMGRQYGLVASVRAGRMNLTRSGRWACCLCIAKYYTLHCKVLLDRPDRAAPVLPGLSIRVHDLHQTDRRIGATDDSPRLSRFERMRSWLYTEHERERHQCKNGRGADGGGRSASRARVTRSIWIAVCSRRQALAPSRSH